MSLYLGNEKIPSFGVSVFGVSSVNGETGDVTGLATEAYVDSAISSIPEPDISGLATEEYVDDAISAIPTPDTMTGSTSSTEGTSGLVPAPASGDENKFLKGDGTWAEVANGATSKRIVLYVDNWTSQSDGSYAQSVSVEGVTAVNVNAVDCVQTGVDKDANIAILQGWGCVNDCKQSLGALKFICYSTLPTVNIPVDVVVM